MPPSYSRGLIEAALRVLDPPKARTARTRSVDDGDLIRDLVPDQRLRVVVEIRDEHSVREVAGLDRSPVGIDRFEDAQIVRQMYAVAAEPGEDALGHRVAVGDRCTPRLEDHLPGFGQQRFEIAMHVAARCAAGRPELPAARQERAVAHEDRRLEFVQPGHDRLDREVDGEEMASVIPGGEGLAERRRDVRRAGGRHDADHPWGVRKGRVSAPVPSLEADVRRVAGRPGVPPVDEDASRAGRAT